MTQGSYTIAGGEVGKRRLNLQHGAYGADTVRLLRESGVRAGMDGLDLGSGGGDTAFEIARLVGPQGSVTGIDADAEIVELAQSDAHAAGFANVVFRVDDVRAYSGPRVDVAFARLLLSHLPDPGQMIATMMTYVRPGGIVAIEDMDVTAAFVDPPTDAFDRAIDVYVQTVRSTGGNPMLARELPRLAADAGLKGVHCRFYQPGYLSGPLKQLGALVIDGMRTAAVSHGVATPAELDSLVGDMREFADRGDTLLVLPRIAQVWGTV